MLLQFHGLQGGNTVIFLEDGKVTAGLSGAATDQTMEARASKAATWPPLPLTCMHSRLVLPQISQWFIDQKKPCLDGETWMRQGLLAHIVLEDGKGQNGPLRS